jgi:hypothetical protein
MAKSGHKAEMPRSASLVDWEEKELEGILLHFVQFVRRFGV